MSLSPKQTLDRLLTVTNAWETICPEKSFGGMTLAEFKTKTQPSIDDRTALDQLRAQTKGAIIRRLRDDTVTEATILQVVNGVLADATEGPNGDLYKAMGYIPRAQRRSGLHRQQPEPTNITPIAA